MHYTYNEIYLIYTPTFLYATGRENSNRLTSVHKINSPTTDIRRLSAMAIGYQQLNENYQLKAYIDLALNLPVYNVTKL